MRLPASFVEDLYSRKYYANLNLITMNNVQEEIAFALPSPANVLLYSIFSKSIHNFSTSESEKSDLREPAEGAPERGDAGVSGLFQPDDGRHVLCWSDRFGGAGYTDLLSVSAEDPDDAAAAGEGRGNQPGEI